MNEKLNQLIKLSQELQQESDKKLEEVFSQVNEVKNEGDRNFLQEMNKKVKEAKEQGNVSELNSLLQQMTKYVTNA